jgi:hypothetical protein
VAVGRKTDRDRNRDVVFSSAEIQEMSHAVKSVDVAGVSGCLFSADFLLRNVITGTGIRFMAGTLCGPTIQ